MSTAAGNDWLRVEGLAAGYGKAVVLNEIDLAVAQGSVVGIAGANGVGKTTLLRALTGVLPRSRGTVTLDGQPVPSSPLRVTRMGIVHVPEGRQLFANLTVRENLRLGAIARGVKNRAAAIDGLCDLFPTLPQFLPRKAGLLSGGQQQLVAVARGLVASPRLLFIDELSLGLSPVAATDITTSAVSACRAHGATLVMVDQNLRLLARHCDILRHVREGQLHPLSLEDVKSGAALF